MNRIKVLAITNVEIDDYHLKNLSELLERNEVEYSFVTFASPDSAFVRGMMGRRKKVYGLNALRRFSYPSAYRSLAKLIRDEKPDIVHTNLFDPSLIGLTVAKRHGLKTVLSRHHSDALYKIESPLKRKFYLILEDYISRKADHIIAPSRMVRDILVNEELVANEKVTVIPYAQTCDRFAWVTPEVVAAKRMELGMNDQLSLVCVSRLYAGKGHKYLFNAVARLVQNGLNAKLYLVGTGTYRSKLEALARKLGLGERVEFLGWREDALAIVGAADIIVHPSLEDALSQAIIEALMLSRPIVATNISGASDTLDSGKYGRLVPPADSKSLQSAIEETLKDLSGARARASKGREYILDYMDAQRVADQTKIVYEKVLRISK